MANKPESRLTDQQRFDWLRLTRSENVGPRTFRALTTNCGGVRAALNALPELARRGGAERASRTAAAAGLTFAERLARGLGQAGYVIVSGLARGIDQRAHVVPGDRRRR